jgi:hypothetical protein
MSAFAPATSGTMVAGKLHRVRKGHKKRFVETAPPTPEPVRRPARLAIMLALAHTIQHAIDRGAVRDRAAVALRLGLTRARVTQLLDLTLLAPDIQEQILFAESVDGLEPMAERAMRAAVRVEDWAKQRGSHGGDGQETMSERALRTAVGVEDWDRVAHARARNSLMFIGLLSA